MLMILIMTVIMIVIMCVTRSLMSICVIVSIIGRTQEGSMGGPRGEPGEAQEALPFCALQAQIIVIRL